MMKTFIRKSSESEGPSDWPCAVLARDPQREIYIRRPWREGMRITLLLHHNKKHSGSEEDKAKEGEDRDQRVII